MRPIYFSEIETPVGNMHVAITDKGICMFEFPDPERLEKHRQQFNAIFEEVDTDPLDILHALKTQLDDYFKGNRTSFELPLELTGTTFQVDLWTSLQKIPYGKTISYLKQATELGNSDAVRAVANANGQNRIAILVPCHRVIASNGSLQGYSGGIWRKEYLLSLEKGQGRIVF